MKKNYYLIALIALIILSSTIFSFVDSFADSYSNNLSINENIVLNGSSVGYDTLRFWDNVGNLYYNNFNNNTLVRQDNIDSIEKLKIPGYNFFGALKRDGSLWLWGTDNKWGEIGNGTTEPQKTPVKILTNVVDFDINSYTSGAIKTDGSLWMWGDNANANVGNGSLDDQLVPTKVLDNVKDVKIGGLDTYAITNDDSLWGWGWNYQLGLNDNTGYQTTPVKIMDNVRSIETGGAMAAIKTDGSLWMWGGNGNKQVTNTEDITIHTPVKIMDSVKDVKTNYSYDDSSHNIAYYTVALKEDGSLWLWGKIGDQLIPEPRHVLNDVRVITSEWDYYFVTAIQNDDNMWVVGGNQNMSFSSPYKVDSNVMIANQGYFGVAYIKNDGTPWYATLSNKNEIIPQSIKFPEASNDSPNTNPSNPDNGGGNVTPTPAPTKNTLFGVTLTKVSKGKKSFTAKWKKASKKQQKQFSGYQIQYSTSPNFSGWVKTKSTTKKSASKVVIRKLKKKTTYYVRMRRYKKSGGGKIYSDWSAIKSVKTK